MLSEKLLSLPAFASQAVRYAVIAVILPCNAPYAEGFKLHLPLACKLGQSCFVQHYVDHDPGFGIIDYACGSQTYDGHNGTDLRLSSMPASAGPFGVVLAAAPGFVLRVRDGVPDISVAETGVAAVSGQECGNGIVVEHLNGYETQYCHLALDSIKVRPGEEVWPGQPIGQVGMSGASEFPHLHFTVRRLGVVIDPFLPQNEGVCKNTGSNNTSKAENKTLWADEIHAGTTYRPGSVLNMGFADGLVEMQAVETERVAVATSGSPAIVAWVRAIGLAPGDIQELRVLGPDGQVFAERKLEPLIKPRAQSLLYAGRRRPLTGWLTGRYQATYRVWRADAAAVEQTFTIELPAQN